MFRLTPNQGAFREYIEGRLARWDSAKGKELATQFFTDFATSSTFDAWTLFFWIFAWV